ncbi:Flp pilus assembly protein CpaB [Vibrio renipiscarius]|uniref:Flp pilus assembly protein CpaB n=1 Tax=Vibrio renipiscarius TaxID=1461322 RepID=UPI0035538AA4
MRSKLFIFIAMMAIGVGVFGLLSPNESTAVVAEVKTVEKPAVLYKIYRIAKSQVKKGQVVNPSDLEIVTISESEAHSLGFDDDALFDYESGSVYKRDFFKGDIFNLSYIAEPSSPEYIDTVISKNNVPYPVKVSLDSIIGGVISSGDNIDILALTGDFAINSELSPQNKEQISLTPILTNIRVLKVEQDAPFISRSGNSEQMENYLIVELDRKQVALLTIAKKIAQIEVHKSIGNYLPNEIQANSGDVLPDFKAIKELRASEIVVN